MCRILFMMYGIDTRAAQLLNWLVSLTWVVVFSLHQLGVMATTIPRGLSFPDHATSFFISTVVVATIAFFVTGTPHRIFKVFALANGALANLLMADNYISEYPPFDMMLIVCTLLGLWLFGAVLYILKCEDPNVSRPRST